MEEEKKTNSKKSSEIAFKSVKIGNQEWMSDNLNVDHFRNGDSKVLYYESIMNQIYYIYPIYLQI